MMVFKPSGYKPPPPAETDDRTALEIMLNVERLFLIFTEALGEEEEEDQPGKTLDGGYAGRERDQTGSL